ncbi:MAG TPA: G1 family glutamic endopeptidase [Solirubrobacteraceae bacterium]|nr:G1 family glutamic endopeptidase [Solirubrobacteraceae bacterium]
MRSRSVLGAALSAAAVSLACAAPSLAAPARAGGIFIPTHAGETLPVHGGTATSLNWSGYAVTPSTPDITAVSSSFTVPTANVLINPLGFAATWTGIGGYSTSDLIQAGVTENTPLTGALSGGQYYAWYEMLPASETPITSGCTGDPSCTVTPGDDVTVHITNAGANAWTIAIADAGKWTWSKTVSYSSSESSAEWILEAPTVGAQSSLADVGTVHFGPTSTYTAGGVTHTIAQGNPTQLDLSPLPIAGLFNEATPSALAADGESFNDCAYAQSCPTP